MQLELLTTMSLLLEEEG